MTYDTIFDLIDQDKTRFVFTYQDKDMERQVYDKHVELKVVGLSGSQSPTDLVVAANLPAVDYKHFPLVDVNTGSLILTLLTGEEFKLNVGLSCVGADKGFHFMSEEFGINTFKSPHELKDIVLREYGEIWFRMNSEFDSSELQENIMFQRGVKAAQLGHRFCNWFSSYSAKRNISMDSFVKIGKIEQELLDQLTSKTLVDLSMSVACKVADGLEISITQLLHYLEEAGVVESQPREIKDGRIQTTKTLASSDEASSDVLPDSSLL